MKSITEIEEHVKKICEQAIFKIAVNSVSDRSGMAYINDQWITDLDAVWIRLNMYGPGFPRENSFGDHHDLFRKILFLPAVHSEENITARVNEAISSMIIEGVKKNEDFANQVQQVLIFTMLDRNIKEVLRNLNSYCHKHQALCNREILHGKSTTPHKSNSVPSN